MNPRSVYSKLLAIFAAAFVLLAPPAHAQSSNLDNQINAIIQQDSKGWAVDKYVSGSARGSHVEWVSDDGQRAWVKTYYTYVRFKKQKQGWVRVEFTGRDFCIRFHNFSDQCRAPDTLSPIYKDAATVAWQMWKANQRRSN